jgi:hypothetical protein
MNYGEWVRRELTRHNRTITWLARELGCSDGLVCKWRSRGSVPNAVLFLHCCKIMAELRGTNWQEIAAEVSKICWQTPLE